MTLETLDPVRTIRSAAQLSRPLFEGKNVDFSVNLPEESRLVYGNERAIRQVLFNLVSNAAQFTPEGGQVSINGELKGEHFAVHVTDTGPGLSPEDIDRLTATLEDDALVSVSSKTGLGLGIGIVRSLIQQMDGDFQINSEIGNGSTFSFTLRLAEAVY